MTKTVTNQTDQIVNRVINMVGAEYGLTSYDLISKLGSKELWMARMIIWTFLHVNLKVTISKISKRFDRAPTNIWRGIRILKNECRFNRKTREDVGSVMKKLNEEVEGI